MPAEQMPDEQNEGLDILQDRVHQMLKSPCGWREYLYVIPYPFRITRSLEEAEAYNRENGGAHTALQLLLTPIGADRG